MSRAEIKQGDIIEVGRLAAPPEGVKHTLNAVFLLLGNPPYQCDHWPYIKKGLLRRSELVRKMQEFDPKTCDPRVAWAAKQVLKPYSEKSLKSVSSAAASLFVWACQAVEEVEAEIGEL